MRKPQLSTPHRKTSRRRSPGTRHRGRGGFALISERSHRRQDEGSPKRPSVVGDEAEARQELHPGLARCWLREPCNSESPPLVRRVSSGEGDGGGGRTFTLTLTPASDCNIYTAPLSTPPCDPLPTTRYPLPVPTTRWTQYF